jgi:hypothetical protein
MGLTKDCSTHKAGLSLDSSLKILNLTPTIDMSSSPTDAVIIGFTFLNKRFAFNLFSRPIISKLSVTTWLLHDQMQMLKQWPEARLISCLKLQLTTDSRIHIYTEIRGATSSSQVTETFTHALLHWKVWCQVREIGSIARIIGFLAYRLRSKNSRKHLKDTVTSDRDSLTFFDGIS